ncbi:MAG: glycine cleavage system aminomethyltransferase GcvT [Chloroflexota bacterium]|nr:glycine cleavage system aminomethyltransferase GcvT [Chloroflexota bacterium]
MKDFLFRGNIADLDPKLNQLIEIEEERQYRRLILIPSESTSPLAVRQALSSGFHNIYAEGYSFGSTGGLSEDQLFDYDDRLAEYRRYSDGRYYKGVEYADILEAVACQRAAEAFATDDKTALDIYVNVQPLSGGPANNAVYHGLVKLGDTVMGMNLLHGGHLSHGSRVNRSGEFYNIVSYAVDPKTEKIDYDEVEKLALEHEPKMIIAGVSSYSWQLDWARFRAIADKVGAYLLADISHVAGLIVAGIYPSPIGHAHIISTTTHKTLCGPRGAILMSTEREIIQKIDRAVFPGEQGGPHVNVFGAMALAFKLAKTDQFIELQKQIVTNCKILADQLEERGFRIPFGGTNTHLLNIDAKSVRGKDNAWLSGDLAARILDVAGIVTNRNTIPGDKSARNPSGVRMGTPWITQRGFKEKETRQLANIIADILLSCEPYYQGRKLRAKVDFRVLESAKLKVRDLAESAGIDFEPVKHGYPHFYYLDDEADEQAANSTYIIDGEKAREYLNFMVSSDIESLEAGQSQPTQLHTPEGIITCMLTFTDSQQLRLTVPAEKAGLALAWLRAVSDGYVKVDQDLLRKIPGPVCVRESDDTPNTIISGNPLGTDKPYYLGILTGEGQSLPDFRWKEEESPELHRTPLYDLHVKLGGRMVPFAGWEMPVRYASVMDEHIAVREAAGLFDVAHMGVYQAEGYCAMAFLDSVCGNDISSLAVGVSLYTHLLDPNANVIDDLLVYRRAAEKYLIVVNASNDAKDWAWLNAVREGKAKIDNARPWARTFGRGVVLRNLRDPKEGADMLVDIALQGPRSRDILLSLDINDADRRKIMHLRRTELCDAKVGGMDLVVSRTGYTGESMSFELFVHPDKVVDLFEAILTVGEPLGLIPAGLGARDSLRTEAGLPLYGHEMSGPLGFGVGEAGFGSYVKTHKPWFIGREAFRAREEKRDGVVVRFRFSDKRVRKAHYDDPVMDEHGRVIGRVTSCATDKDGYFLGQAYVKNRYAKKGTQIFIYQDVSKRPGKSLLDLDYGERVALPEAATILRRFPRF